MEDGLDADRKEVPAFAGKTERWVGKAAAIRGIRPPFLLIKSFYIKIGVQTP